MKLTVQHHRVRSSDKLDSLIENRLLRLEQGLRIDEATVRLACDFKQSPAFSVHVHMAMPGLDVFTESRDHTIRAAIEKAMTDVNTIIKNRAQKRHWRIRSNLQQPAILRMGQHRR